MNEEQEPTAFDLLAEGLIKIGNVMKEVAESFAEHVMVPLCNALQETYKEAGSPYGDTQEGLLLWMEVISSQKRHEQEEEYKRMREA